MKIGKCEGKCGKVKETHRSKDNGKMLCEKCRTWEFGRKRCSRCKRKRPIGGYDGKKVVCDSCWQIYFYQPTRPTERCIFCRNDRPVACRLPEGPACKVCRKRYIVRNDDGHRNCVDPAHGGKRKIGGKYVFCPTCYNQQNFISRARREKMQAKIALPVEEAEVDSNPHR